MEGMDEREGLGFNVIRRGAFIDRLGSDGQEDGM